MIVLIKEYKKRYISAHVFGYDFFCVRAFSRLYSDPLDLSAPIEGEELWTLNIREIGKQTTFDNEKFLLWLFKKVVKSDFDGRGLFLRRITEAITDL